MKTAKFAVNWDVMRCLIRDEGFGHQVFVNRSTGEIFSVYANDEDTEFGDGTPEDNQEHWAALESHPDQFIEIPVPSYALHETWFKDFLFETGRECYGSIRRTLGKYYATDGDASVAHEWTEFQNKCLDRLAQETLQANGIEF